MNSLYGRFGLKQETLEHKIMVHLTLEKFLQSEISVNVKDIISL